MLYSGRQTVWLVCGTHTLCSLGLWVCVCVYVCVWSWVGGRRLRDGRARRVQQQAVVGVCVRVGV